MKNFSHLAARNKNNHLNRTHAQQNIFAPTTIAETAPMTQQLVKSYHNPAQKTAQQSARPQPQQPKNVPSWSPLPHKSVSNANTGQQIRKRGARQWHRIAPHVSSYEELSTKSTVGACALLFTCTCTGALTISTAPLVPIPP